jgi:dipeptidase D
MPEHPMTPRILEAFRQVSAIPRRSKHEARIRAWLIDWAGRHGFPHDVDSVGNLVIRVPGSAGHEHAPMVTLQGHLDMVCEKTPESPHDFATDPIVPVVEGDWLTAPGTTLGADNGIAIAIAMVAATEPSLVHPPLELFFTIDEETGLTGASELKPGFLQGSVLLNIDSEDEGVITVGCAGGIDTHLRIPIPHEDRPVGFTGLQLHAGGMSGGHSGVDIHKMRANAIRVLARAVLALDDAFDLRLADLRGGTAHNAIPRDASADLLVHPSDVDAIRAQVAQLGPILAAEFARTDPGLFLELRPYDGACARCPSQAGTAKILDLLLVMPHGPAAMSTDIEGLVETSNNEAEVKLDGEALVLLSSQRSSVVSRLEGHTRRIEALGRLAGGTAKSGTGYPPWQPNMDSPLLARAQRIYRALHGKDPVVEVIHAGLECGIIGDRYPDMDMISIGPTIVDPHSPDERLLIPTVGQVWDYLVALLADLAEA